jgi:hypothetical protein
MYSREIEADRQQKIYILIELHTEEEFTLIKKNCTPTEKNHFNLKDRPVKCSF